jgi:hypothetical protein
MMKWFSRSAASFAIDGDLFVTYAKQNGQNVMTWAGLGPRLRRRFRHDGASAAALCNRQCRKSNDPVPGSGLPQAMAPTPVPHQLRIMIIERGRCRLGRAAGADGCLDPSLRWPPHRRLEPQETILSPSSLRRRSFGLLRTVQVDDDINVQALVVTGQPISGAQGNRTVVYVATEANTMYAIDASTGEILLTRNWGPPVPRSAVGGCNLNGAEIGIDATPVIDRSTGQLYMEEIGSDADVGGSADNYESGVRRIMAQNFKGHILRKFALRVDAVKAGC